jgi:hypothetical protein
MTYYDRVGPFGDRRADAQAALIAQTISNIYRNKDRDPYTIEDFMLKLKPSEAVQAPTRKQTAEEQFAIFEAVRIAQNAQWEKANA